MESSSGCDDGDLVVLKCIDPDLMEPEADDREVVVSTSEISVWDLLSILDHQVVIVKADRNRLIEQSSYFSGLLCGSFSESLLDCVEVKWNLETLMTLLKFIFGSSVDVTSGNFLPLFEGALFFGVEMLLKKCKTWLSQVASSSINSEQIKLDSLIHIWKYGAEHANDFIPELCTGYLARNFMWAMYRSSFCDVPVNLLISSMRHPDLTVNSERHLADACLLWLTANTEQSKSLGGYSDAFLDILKEIRFSLLPLGFAAGKRRCYYFSRVADESSDAILGTMRSPTANWIQGFCDGDLRQLKLRLTKFTKKVDLSGCPQIRASILLVSMFPCAFSTDLVRKVIKQSSNNLEYLDSSQFQISWALLPNLSFEAVEEVDISNCRGLHLETSIEIFSRTFPSLRILRAAYFLNFKMTKLPRLLQKFPHLSQIDLKVDMSPIISTEVSVLSSSSGIPSQVSTVTSEITTVDCAMSYLSNPLMSNITKLTLEGRTDVDDFDLKNISELCVSLCYLNIRGCTSVTDAGISILICNCLKLHSLLVCYTSFGDKSILALTSSLPNLSHLPTLEIGAPRNKSLASQLQILHMGGCNGISETTLSKLVAQVSLLKNLCLREIQLVDNTLYSFSGSFLEVLDVSDTKVSGAALSHVISGNPRLKCLKARGCKNLFQQERLAEGRKLSHCLRSGKEWFMELGKTCNLDEIALGWGFSCFSLETLKPAVVALRVLTVGLGGSLHEGSLELLPTICPFLEVLILYFQVISDSILMSISKSLTHLQELGLYHCLGEISHQSFNLGMPNLRKLRLERVTPLMSNDDLVVFTQNCGNLIELSLAGCKLLNSDSQKIISRGWPGLISICLEDCGEITTNGVDSLLDCKALEDLVLRHNGPGIQRRFILDAASRMPMLRKLSLDICDGSEGDFDLPDFTDRCFLSIVKIARCKSQRCSFDLKKMGSCRVPVPKETLVLVWNSKNLTRTVVKERI